jgi:hypothetical protein
MRKKQELEIDYQPETDVELPYPKVEESDWDQLAESLMIQVDISLGNRESFDSQLDANNALYEMRAQDTGNDLPTPGAPNIVVPFIATAVDEFSSRIAGTAILPRPFIVRGNDPDSARTAHSVEQFYNGEWTRNEWEEQCRTAIHLGARDGTSVMAVNWELRTVKRLVKANTPDPISGKTVKQDQMVTMIKYDAPKWEPVEVRDFVLFPDYAKSVDDAASVMRKRYMTEPELWAMVKNGVLNEDMVERALSYTSPGQGDLTFDRQGYSPYTINNRINVVDVSIAPPGGMKMNRGPLQIWQIHTSLYDLDGDGVTEENIFWVHDHSRLMLGYAPYQYWGDRPYFPYAPFPRPNRFYGFGIPERLQALQAEADYQHIGRLEALDFILNPTYLVGTGARMAPEEQRVDKGMMIKVQNTQTDLKLLDPPQISQNSIQEEQLLEQYAKSVVGAPQVGGNPPQSGGSTGGGGRQSARAAQSMAAVQGLQTNMIIARTRLWMLKMFKFSHNLYRQYGQDQLSSVDSTGSDGVKRVKIPREILSQDYTLAIAGMGGPLDKESRKEDNQVLYQMLMANPLVQGKLDRVYAITQDLLETYDKPEVTRFIGTMDEANQQMQQQAQAQQQAAQMQLTKDIITHAKIGAKNEPAKSQGNSGGANRVPQGAGLQ